MGKMLKNMLLNLLYFLINKQIIYNLILINTNIFFVTSYRVKINFVTFLFNFESIWID